MRPVPRRRRRATGLIAALGALAVLAGSLTACGSTEPRDLLESIRSGHVILGTKFDQPGLGLENPGGGITGFDAAVSKYVVTQIAGELGVDMPEISWKETPSAQRETFIRNGEVDTIAATYSITEPRMKDVDFAGPYLVTYQGLLARADDDNIQRLSDMADNRKLCSAAGSTPAQNVKRLLSGVQLQQFDSYSSCVEGLRRDKVDAVTTDEIILAGYSNFWQDEFKLVDMTYDQDTCVKGALKKEGAPFSFEYYGIGMAKNYPEAVTQVNKALKKMLVVPPGERYSPWEKALREALGDPFVDNLIERAQRPGSQYLFQPDPGDLSFLTAATTECTEGAR